MRQILFTLFCLPTLLFAQGEQATLLGQWSDNSLIVNNWPGGAYNEVWGVVVNDLEVAIIGSTEGAHFIDVTNPSNPIELADAYVEGADGGAFMIHRDYDDYNGYLYAVADEGSSTLQIIDMNGLPEGTTVVYDDNELIENAHNIFIDKDKGKLYACGGFAPGVGGFKLAIFSLANPIDPLLIGYYSEIGGVQIPNIHDMYVRNDTAYLNGSNQGFYVADFSNVVNPEILGVMTNYTQQGYNHSGWLDQEGHYYYLADENHGLDIKAVDVCNKDDIHVLSTLNSGIVQPNRIPHNLIVRCNRLYASYYYDGLVVFDISDPNNIERILHYDTYDGANGTSYLGAWGIYPLLPSGNILISDINTGLYVFEGIDENCDYNNANACFPSATNEANTLAGFEVVLAPQPATDFLQMTIQSPAAYSNVQIELYDFSGKYICQLLTTDLMEGANTLQFDEIKNLCAGFYIINMVGENLQQTKKMVINR